MRLGPDYRRPQVVTPQAIKESKDWKIAEPRDAVPRGKWWEIFGDPQLNALTDKVNVSNQSLRLAEAQYRRAQALTQSARASLFPTVAAALGNAQRFGNTRCQPPTTILAANASWDADLWGRVRRNVESSEALAAASAADLESVRLLMQSNWCSITCNCACSIRRKYCWMKAAAAFAKSLELTQNRYKAGLAGRVDVAQAEAQLKSTQAQAIDTGVQRAQLEHAIAVLLGASPAEFALAPAPIKAAMPAIPAGLPSELLERRPDIAGRRAARRRGQRANRRGEGGVLSVTHAVGQRRLSKCQFRALAHRAEPLLVAGAGTGANRSLTAAAQGINRSGDCFLRRQRRHLSPDGAQRISGCRR